MYSLTIVVAPDCLPIEFQIIFIRSVLKNWLQPEKEHFAYRDDVRFVSSYNSVDAQNDHGRARAHTQTPSA